jgi:hypothetical protein
MKTTTALIQVLVGVVMASVTVTTTNSFIVVPSVSHSILHSSSRRGSRGNLNWDHAHPWQDVVSTCSSPPLSCTTIHENYQGRSRSKLVLLSSATLTNHPDTSSKKAATSTAATEEDIISVATSTRTRSVKQDDTSIFVAAATSLEQGIVSVVNVKVKDQVNITEQVPTTMRQALQTFFLSKKYPGPSLVVLTIVTMVATRLGYPTVLTTASTSLGSFACPPLGWMDAVVAGTAIVFWWFQEHVLHQRLLHSKRNWMGKAIHEAHHDKHYFHISIDPAALLLGWLFSVFAVLTYVLSPLVPPNTLALSATIGYSVAGLGYEWAHYIVHTKVKPRSKFFQQVRDNHMRHHLVSSDYWYGFSLPQMDDWFGTNPSVQQVRQEQQQQQQHHEHQHDLLQTKKTSNPNHIMPNKSQGRANHK